MITTQIELDVSPGGIAPVIHVSQYDTGSRTLPGYETGWKRLLL